MSDIIIEQPERIHEAVTAYSRFRFLVTSTYGILIEDITSLRVDGDNFKIDVRVGERMFRFKAKGLRNALVPSQEDPAILKMVLDPALAQAIHELVSDYAS